MRDRYANLHNLKGDRPEASFTGNLTRELVLSKKKGHLEVLGEA